MKNFTKIQKLVNESKDILITCHLNPDGDCIGSMLALGLALKSRRKNVDIVSADGVPKIYHELPGARLIRQMPKLRKKPYDLAISVDCTTKEILGVDFEIFNRSKATIEIDHHQIRDSFAQISLLENNAAANGEIIYKLLKYLKIPVTRNIAKNILTSIIVETNSFRLPEVRSLTFEICAELMQLGVNFSELTNMVYWAQRKQSAILTGVSLSRCKFLKQGRLVHSCIRSKDFKDKKGLFEDVDAVPDLMRSIRGVKVAIFFREQAKGILRVSLRSKDRINVAQLAKEYKGGGHFDVAGCFLRDDKKEIAKFISKASRLIKD